MPGRGGAADFDRAVARPAGCARPSRWRRRRAAPGRRSRSTSRFPTAPAASARCRRRSPRRSASGAPAWLRRRRRDRRNAPQSHRHWSGRTAARRSAPPRLPPARSRAHPQAVAARSARRAETARPRSAPARPRATGWSGTGPDRCCRGLSAGASLVMPESISFPQHIGIDRRCPQQILPQPPGTASQASARAIASSDRSPTASVTQAPCFRSSSTISAMPTLEAILRASGRLSVLRGRRPDSRSSTGSASVHHAANAWSGAPGSTTTGVLPMRPTAEVRPGCSAMPWAMISPRSRQCRHRRIGAADAAAADGQQQIARARHRAPQQSMRHRGRRRRRQSHRRRRSRALSAIRSAVTVPPGILTMRSRGRRTCNLAIPAARAIRRSRAQDAPPGLDDAAACGNIAAGPAHPLPRDRFRQHLRHRTRLVDGIGIEHAVAAVGDGIAGFDPDRRRRQRQRRIGGRADEIAGAQRKAVGGGDVARRQCARARGMSAAMQRSASASGSSTGATGSTPCSSAASADIERRKRSRQALVRGHGSRYALNRAGNKQNPIPPAVAPSPFGRD